MLTILIALGSFFAFIVAYHTYGRWLSRKIFALDNSRPAPSHELRDNVDFVPTKRSVVFGHHFTSIAGTGPIVGPAIAVFWGWLPALLWVVFGSILIGAVHDFGALVVSLRNRGQTVGDIAGRVISPRAKMLFLVILFFALSVVIAIFGLVIANIFAIYPESVLSVVVAIPVALIVGILVYKKNVGLLGPSLFALAILYGAVYLGANGWAITLEPIQALGPYGSPVIQWTIMLLIYCFAASVLPVWLLLQPRDYINSHQLMVALALLVGGLVVAAAKGDAKLESAPAIATQVPADAPPMLPFLFIIIACGACSGFHCLVSSGTTSKQLDCETDAQYVGYGSMLLEGALAVIVILACSAGVGMGVTSPATGEQLTGREAWQSRYAIGPQDVVAVDGTVTTVTKGWSSMGLKEMVGAFVDGGANFVMALGFSQKLSITIIAVLVACFAATTLDTATRLQRYVIQELGHAIHVPPLTNAYVATTVAVVCGGAIAMMPGPSGVPGTGGLILWPLFGATNQLLAGLAFLVLLFYLRRRGIATWFVVIPMLFMLLMPAWGMIYNLMFDWRDNWVLMTFGIGILALEAWMIVEGLLVWQRSKGVLEPSLPPLASVARSEARG